MKIAIVTPFHSEPVEQLARNMRSVHEQEGGPFSGVVGHPAPSFLTTVEHLIVSDGADLGRAVEAMKLASLPTQNYPRVISLPVAHADWGNCARAVGALDAVARGFDAIGFLDGDNWLDRGHIATMVALHDATGAAVCTTSRMICRVDGTAMFVDQENDGDRHVDSNCFFFTRAAFYLLPFWAFVPPSHAAIGDRVFWQIVKRAPGLVHSHSLARTVKYRTRYAVHYRATGEQPPPEAKEAPPAPAGIVLQPRTLLLPILGEQ